jgi:predicted dehydrogenase
MEPAMTPAMKPVTNLRLTRRSFLRSISTAGLLLPTVMPALVRGVSPMSKLRHVSFGADGMAWSDIMSLTRHPALELAMVCEVDERRTKKVKEKFPATQLVADWQEVFEKHADKFDSCNVTVPDHMHASIAMAALRRDKHCYCQKPLTHNVTETRSLVEEAGRRSVATQMGIQIHSQTEYRLAVQLVQAGVIGKVKAAHLWSNKTWGGNDLRPDRSDPIPPGFNWHLWLGPAPHRPYVHGLYHPENWRRWLDFGTGTLGDMGCHIFSPVFAALALTSPTTIQSTGDAPGVEQWAIRGLIRYTFPPTAFTTDEPLPLTWYDGGTPIDPEVVKLLGDTKPHPQGSILIGTDGVMHIPHVGGPRLFPQEKFKDFKYPRLEADDHWSQFVDVAMGKRDKTLAPFAFAGPLTESVLLGNVAARFPGQTLTWDSAKLAFPSHPDADQFLKRE